MYMGSAGGQDRRERRKGHVLGEEVMEEEEMK
jgi:hypothetical protein